MANDIAYYEESLFGMTNITGATNTEVTHELGRRLAVEQELVSALELEAITGTRASTWRYWASLDPPQGPASFKLGRRRVWRKSAVLEWLAEQEAATARGGGQQSEQPEKVVGNALVRD